MAIISTIKKAIGNYGRSVATVAIGNAAAKFGENLLHHLMAAGTVEGQSNFEMQAPVAIDKPRLVDQIGSPASAEGVDTARVRGLDTNTGEVGEPAVKLSGEDLIQSLEVLHGHIISTMQQIDRNSIARYEETTKRLDRTEDHIISLSTGMTRMQNNISSLDDLYHELSRRFSHMENRQHSINLLPGGGSTQSDLASSRPEKKDDSGPGWLASLGQDAFEGWLFNKAFKSARGVKAIEDAAAKKVIENDAKKLASGEAERMATKEAEKVVARDSEKIVGKGMAAAGRKVAGKIATKVAERSAIMGLGAMIPGLGWIFDAGLAAYTVYEVYEALKDYVGESGGSILSTVGGAVTAVGKTVAEATTGAVNALAGGHENKGVATQTTAASAYSNKSILTGQTQYSKYGPDSGTHNPNDILGAMNAIGGGARPHLPGERSNPSMVPNAPEIAVSQQPQQDALWRPRPTSNAPPQQGMWHQRGATPGGHTVGPGVTGSYTPGILPPSQHVGGPSGIDRTRFATELKNNPALREKILRIAANEEGTRAGGTQAILESMMNRAEVRGTSLEVQARWYGTEKGGYYARGSMGRGALENPKQNAILEQSLANALAGSNISNYATDNASSWLSKKEAAAGTFRVRSNFGGRPGANIGDPGVETFFSPGSAQPKMAQAYDRWLRERQDAATKGEAVPPPPTPAPPQPATKVPDTTASVARPYSNKSILTGNVPDHNKAATPAQSPPTTPPNATGKDTSIYDWHEEAAGLKEGWHLTKKAASWIGKTASSLYAGVTASGFKGDNWLQRQEAQNAELNAEAGGAAIQKTTPTTNGVPLKPITEAPKVPDMKPMPTRANADPDMNKQPMPTRANADPDMNKQPMRSRKDPEVTAPDDNRYKSVTGSPLRRDPVKPISTTAHPEEQPDEPGSRPYGQTMDPDRIGICSL